MTDKELRKLKRTELLELMLYLRQELDAIKKENEELRRQLDDSRKNCSEADEKFYSVINEMSDKIDVLYRMNAENKDAEAVSLSQDQDQDPETEK